jgi:hypothetical protein
VARGIALIQFELAVELAVMDFVFLSDLPTRALSRPLSEVSRITHDDRDKSMHDTDPSFQIIAAETLIKMCGGIRSRSRISLFVGDFRICAILSYTPHGMLS